MMDPHEREMFSQSVRVAAEQHTGDALDAILTEIGWRDAYELDRQTAVSILFESLGSTNAISDVLELVLRDALGLGPDPANATVLPALGHHEPPGRVDGNRIVVDGLVLNRKPRDKFVVVVRHEPSDVACVVEPGCLAVTPVTGVDPQFKIATVAGTFDLGDHVDVDWTRAVSLAQRAISHELVGVSKAMVRLAREHALARVQFGRPIAEFQAVRHRLVDALVAGQASESILAEAWRGPSAEFSAMAKSVAGRSAAVASRNCQQVFGGIGFTSEHRFHRYFRRALLLDQLFGSTQRLTHELGETLAGSRRLPDLPAL